MSENSSPWWAKREQHQRQKKNERFYLNRERNQRFYQSRKWHDLRQYKLALNPLCEICAGTGLTVIAEEIHHTININLPEGWRERFNVDLLQSLCKSCHSRITVLEQKERRHLEMLAAMLSLNQF